MSAAQTFREQTESLRPQDPLGNGTGLRFETGEHGRRLSRQHASGCMFCCESTARSSWLVSERTQYAATVQPVSQGLNVAISEPVRREG